MSRLRLWGTLAAIGALAACASMGAPTANAPMNLVSASGVGVLIGHIRVTASPSGVAFHVAMHGLPPGDHGMHVHVNAACVPGPNASGEVVAAGAAGAHYDPTHAGHHGGPNGDGHLGDLPLLNVDAAGNANVVLVAPHVHDVSQLRGRAIIIHANGDNYSDAPAPLGGGGARIACGVVG